MEHRDVKLRCPHRDGSRACNRVIGVAWVRPDGSIDTILSASKGGPGVEVEDVEELTGFELPPIGQLAGKPTNFNVLFCARHGKIPLGEVYLQSDP